MFSGLSYLADTPFVFRFFRRLLENGGHCRGQKEQSDTPYHWSKDFRTVRGFFFSSAGTDVDRNTYLHSSSGHLTQLSLFALQRDGFSPISDTAAAVTR